jgi:hypothetical protein
MNNFETKVRSRNIFETEATIVHEQSKEVGKITKLAGDFENTEIKLFLAHEGWEKISIDFLPTLSIKFEVDNESNFVKINSSNKVISPIKKGDSLTIYFEDGSFIERKFEAGRIQSGKNVSNLIVLNDLDLIILSQNKISHFETFSGLKFEYRFTEIENIQYSKSSEGKELFQIICKKIMDVKILLKNSNDSLTQLTSNKVRFQHIVNTDISKFSILENSNDMQPVEFIAKTNSTGPFKDEIEDHSIIEISDQYENLNPQNTLNKVIVDVPYWAHKYVYSNAYLDEGSIEQQEFYKIFKNNFLNGNYFDLKGNNNYAFILLFDFLDDFDVHKDLSKLEKQLNLLGQNYPKTKSYVNSFLIQKLELSDKSDDQLKDVKNEISTNQNFEYSQWKLGNKYKYKLNLTDQEIKLLNKLWYPSTSFCNIEFCCVEIIKLYISLFSELELKLRIEDTTCEKEFFFVADTIVRRQFNYSAGTQSYSYYLETVTNGLYSNVFKHCENAVRELYGQKRKLYTETYYDNKNVQSVIESKITSRVNELLPILTYRVAKLNEATEIVLNSQITNRWKTKFNELTTNYDGKSQNFVEDIIELAKLNNKNPFMGNIFFEGSKFIAKYDSLCCLLLQVHYLYHGLNSVNNKQLSKIIQKKLFKTDEQLQDYQVIVAELEKDKDLDGALAKVLKIFEVKRKKIYLNKSSINEVQKQHSGTVDLLNEYLNDEVENDIEEIQSSEINGQSNQIYSNQQKAEFHHSVFLSQLALNSEHITILELFIKSNFSITQLKFEEFAKSKGLFKNQVIDSINEICFEVLDDVLIEEDKDFITIIPEYLNKISTNHG